MKSSQTIKVMEKLQTRVIKLIDKYNDIISVDIIKDFPDGQYYMVDSKAEFIKLKNQINLLFDKYISHSRLTEDNIVTLYGQLYKLIDKAEVNIQYKVLPQGYDYYGITEELEILKEEIYKKFKNLKF